MDGGALVGNDPAPDYPKQIWFVLIMVLVLVGLVLSVALGMAPERRKSAARVAISPTAAAVMPQETASATHTFAPAPRSSSTISPTAQATTTRTSTATNTGARTSTPAAAPSLTETSAPSETPSPTETPAREHFWLESPFSSEYNDRVARFYPYASRLDGTYPIHHGVEYGNETGTPVLATASGMIIVAGNDDDHVYGARDHFYGLVVIQELDRLLEEQPIYVLYGHLSTIDVQVGQTVDVGDALGSVGMTGVAEGPHLHMEIRAGGNDYSATVNPVLWVRPASGHGVLAGRLDGSDGAPITEAKLTLSRSESPDTVERDIVTYPAREVNADPTWNENYAIGDLEAGSWIVKLYHLGRLYTAEVTIHSGVTSWLALRTTS